MARATRATDLRYWFGGTVTFDREDGRRQTFRIVGEDEAARRASAQLRELEHDARHPD
jgi:transcription elongation GreA/GreB family factor